jgi:hypothetical protein
MGGLSSKSLSSESIALLLCWADIPKATRFAWLFQKLTAALEVLKRLLR